MFSRNNYETVNFHNVNTSGINVCPGPSLGTDLLTAFVRFSYGVPHCLV